MTFALALIFGFMVFMLIMRKGNLLFVNITSLLVIAAISFGVGYGMSIFVTSLLGPLLKVLLVVIATLVGAGLLLSLRNKKGK